MSDFALPVVVSKGLSQYLDAIKKFPVLDASNEYVLAKRYIDYNDVDAAHTLVTSYLRLAAKIAMMYRNYGLPLADLISEANIGLMTAVKKFNPDKGFRLSTYAVWWIKAELHDFILRSWSLVRIGTIAAQKKLFYNLSKIKAKLGLYADSDIDDVNVEKISKTLGVDVNEVREMNARITGDVSLNVPLSIGDDAGERQDFIEDTSPSQEMVVADGDEYAYRKRLFDGAMMSLNDREREIIIARRLRSEPVTLEELADKYGISRERVRQIEQRAYEKICEFVKDKGIS